MIGTVDVEIIAKFPSMPLDPMQAFVDSPSSIRLRNVPKRIGKWCIDSVSFVAAYPDGTIKTAECVLVGGVWTGTIEGTSTPGKSEKGYTIYASGTDENGNAVTGYILGKGDIEILDADGTLTPGETLAYVHLLSAGATGEKDGDLWQTDGTWKIRQDGQAWLIGDDSGMIAQLSAELSGKADLSAMENALSGKQDALTDAQISAIDSVVDERATVVKYQDGTISSFNIVGELGENSIPNKGNAVEVKIGSSVTSIGEGGLGNFANLTSVTIPDSVTSIGDGAFGGCYGLSGITIPDSVTSIGDWAFYYCSALTSVTFKGKTLEQVQQMDNYPWEITGTSIIKTWNDASKEWVEGQGYLSSIPNTYKIYSDTVSALSGDGYATQTWVGQQGYITSSYPVKNDGGVANAKAMTQNAYDALQTKDATTLYVITEN